MMCGVVKVVGLGPGNQALLAPAGRQAVESADVILGYTTYLDLIADIAPDVPRQSSGMRKELERAGEAIRLASQGSTAVVVSGGDPGIYGMAGLIFEMREQTGAAVEIEVFPGISALNAAASLLGAPLMTDFAVVSLSDHLVTLEEITKRLELIAQTDFVLCLYNPKGKKRVKPFEEACKILLKWRAPETVIGVVRKAYRPGQQVTLVPLGDLPNCDIDMLTVIIVGNQKTRVIDGKMVTPRGYRNKYEFSEGV